MITYFHGAHSPHGDGVFSGGDCSPGVANFKEGVFWKCHPREGGSKGRGSWKEGLIMLFEFCWCATLQSFTQV